MRLGGLLALCGLSASAQPVAAGSVEQQQAANEARVIQQQAYQQAMMDCMGTAFPAPGSTEDGRPADPSVYSMTDSKMQIVIKCMDGKGIGPPAWIPPGAGKFAQDYQKKNSASSRQMMSNQANLIAAMWKREAEAVAGNSQAAISPAAPSGDVQPGVTADPSAPTGNAPPKIYNTPQSGGNDHSSSGQKPLWVVPQSQ